MLGTLFLVMGDGELDLVVGCENDFKLAGDSERKPSFGDEGSTVFLFEGVEGVDTFPVVLCGERGGLRAFGGSDEDTGGAD